MGGKIQVLSLLFVARAKCYEVKRPEFAHTASLQRHFQRVGTSKSSFIVRILGTFGIFELIAEQQQTAQDFAGCKQPAGQTAASIYDSIRKAAINPCLVASPCFTLLNRINLSLCQSHMDQNKIGRHSLAACDIHCSNISRLISNMHR